MNIHDIVYLKSSKEKMMITWVDGIGKDKQGILIDKTMQNRPEYQKGQISVKFGKQKATFPKSCLIDNLEDRVKAVDSILKVGNVVKHKLTNQEMTITWIVGQDKSGKNVINLNKLYVNKGYKAGDIVCAYLDKKEYKSDLFQVGEVEKLYE